MTITFGISFGDCVAGGKLLKDVTEAFGTSRKAEKEYGSLMLMIKSLEPILLGAQALRTEQDSEQEIEYYKRVAKNIEDLLESFVDQVAKFDGTMTVGTSNWAERVGSACRKLEWTFLKPLVQDFMSNLNTQMSILNAIPGQIYLKKVVKPPSTQSDGLLFQSLKCANQRETQQESVSSNSPISLSNGEETTPLDTELTAEESGMIPNFSAYQPAVSYDQVDSTGLLSRSDSNLTWPNQEFLLESQLVFNHFPSNPLHIPRRKSCRLPIKDPADGSVKIFLQSTETANQSSRMNDPIPCFTIPGAKNSRLTIKSPLGSSIKLPENETKCVKKRSINTDTHEASPLFARPTGTKVVVKDPLNMSILDFVSKTYS